jgi:hypothetical protein
MSDVYVVAIDGLDATRPLEALPARIRRNALRAVNYAADRERTRGARQIREQAAFRASDLSPNGERFVVRKARTIDEGAEIRARWRPTSLAKFATRSGKRGVTLQVKPGQSVRSNKMFLIRLRSGTSDIETKSNTGLAIRLKKGETVQGKKFAARQLAQGLFLLYGPSISQIYRSVAGNDVADVEQDLQREFTRLMEAGID